MEPEFDAEAFDMSIEGAGVGGITVAPDRTEKLGAVADLQGCGSWGWQALIRSTRGGVLGALEERGLRI